MDLFFRETGHGQPLLILHGLFGSSDNWMSIAKALQEHYTCIIPDLRNHGQSPKSEEWDYRVMVEDLLELIQKLGLNSTYMLGHSMGGKLAMEFSLFNPSYISKLVVADISPRHYPVHHQTILEGLSSLDLGELKSRKEADEILSSSVPEFGVRAFLLKNLGRDDEGKFEWKLNLDVISRNIEEVGISVSDGLEFDHPTLFMRGERSKYVSDQDFENAKSIFPDSELVTIPDAGHWLHAEKPVEFVKELRKFLDQ